ncbi:hypothetical protein [Flagellimonas meishanensis]|uniref:hypothetical protein n=1 Tax=Flagellimonas meishanensis TaxID=2873264 RepID=UPI001CA755EA|nr:hypothetical protein [[Muricauda] meishanensis]
MTTKKLFATSMIILVFAVACKNSEKDEQELNQKLEQIESVEQAVDSTLNQVEQKASEVEEMIKELDSI